MKNIDIITTVNAFQHVDGTLSLPASVAWTRRVNFRKLTDAKSIIDEAMQELQRKYADDEHSYMDGDQRKVKEEYLAEFVKAQSEILVQETDVSIKKVSIEDLGNIQLTDKQMDTIAFMIEEDDGE